ncbi:hypothetical protein TNCV_1515481 [Trichonephila clavipes]|nr:hypothetical protein TNCV_1515481 [Trichonephila clavipes]
MFRQVLMHPSERLMIRLPPRWIPFPMQPNSNTFIAVGMALVEVDIRQLGVRITIHVHHTLPLSEMRKPHIPTCELPYSATYHFRPILSYVIMATYDILYLPSKFVHGIRDTLHM